MLKFSRLVYIRKKQMRAQKNLTICFDSEKLTIMPALMIWFNTIGAEIEEGQIAIVSFPATTQLRGITPRKFRVFEPGISGELIVDLELNTYETGITFEWGKGHNDA